METSEVLETIVKRVLEVFPDAHSIVLFGSRAKGTARKDSDYDVLVVTPTELSPASRGTRLRLALRSIPWPFDILVVTPEEYGRLLTFKSGVVYWAAKEGKVLHEAA
jgi:predicted nucleotidyltransferase